MVYIHPLFLYEMFISMYIYIQVQVATAFATIVHFKIWIKITKSSMTGPCMYWQLGE